MLRDQLLSIFLLEERAIIDKWVNYPGSFPWQQKVNFPWGQSPPGWTNKPHADVYFQLVCCVTVPTNTHLPLGECVCVRPLPHHKPLNLSSSVGSPRVSVDRNVVLSSCIMTAANKKLSSDSRRLSFRGDKVHRGSVLWKKLDKESDKSQDFFQEGDEDVYTLHFDALVCFSKKQIWPLRH